MKTFLAAAAVAVIAAGAANDVLPHDYDLHALHIDHPFARATPPGARNGSVYMTIDNRGRQGDRLLRAASPVARSVSLHRMTMDSGIMRMRGVAGVDIKAGGRLVLEPGGYHLMLEDLNRPLKAGERFPLTLEFEKSGSIEVQVAVEGMGAGATPAHSPH